MCEDTIGEIGVGRVDPESPAWTIAFKSSSCLVTTSSRPVRVSATLSRVCFGGSVKYMHVLFAASHKEQTGRFRSHLTLRFLQVWLQAIESVHPGARERARLIRALVTRGLETPSGVEGAGSVKDPLAGYEQIEIDLPSCLAAPKRWLSILIAPASLQAVGRLPRLVVVPASMIAHLISNILPTQCKSELCRSKRRLRANTIH